MDDTKWMTLRRVKRMFADLAAKRLDTLNAITSNTSPGMLAGASAVNELNGKLGDQVTYAFDASTGTLAITTKE